MRWFFAAAGVILLASPARAATYEHREETTGFRLHAPPDARVCVAYPREKRGGDCDGLDLTMVRQRFSNETLFLVHTTDWVLGVSVVPENANRERDWTHAEARDFRESFVRKTPAEANVAIGPLAERRIAGLQVLSVRSEFGNTGAVGRTDFVIGKHGVTRVTYEFAGSAADTVAPAIEAIANSYDAQPATTTNGEIAITLATLLAGAPLVVIAATLASRKREDA